jgi:putative glutamine amidotransferase
MVQVVQVEPDSGLATLMRTRLSPATTMGVNSRHHQAVNRVGDGLRVVAVAGDGIVEAVEDPAARFCLGVQWHPENFWRTGAFQPLFDGFVEACRSSSRR